jgi:ribosome-binding factor A
MSSRRIAKVAEALREQVSTSILFELKDPRVKYVTVTRVEVSADLRSAKIYVSVMGDEKTQRLTLRGLESARGFLQAKIAEGVQLRYTPILQFHLDQGIKKSIEASRLLREVLPESASAAESMEELSTEDRSMEGLPIEEPIEEESLTEDEVAESTLFEGECAGPVSPALPVSQSPFERHTENQDG